MRTTSAARDSPGSSPRTRGTDECVLWFNYQGRFIPAHAGNSPERLASCQCSPVHPRARGEQILEFTRLPAAIGSSPRTRGTGGGRDFHQSAHRFIPAHAGNRSTFNNSGKCGAVHPRARGEQACVSSVARSISGSSPRTRGTEIRAAGPCGMRRFIPAHAGNSSRQRYDSPASAVHPRARGEQDYIELGTSSEAGSSPRTRGTAEFPALRAHDVRFIPAHAGNSASSGCRARGGQVHPRARGEQRSLHVTSQPTAGSSPRTRGTGQHGLPSQQQWRFIPAHAGNSRAARVTKWNSTVHPRARGEQGSKPS